MNAEDRRVKMTKKILKEALVELMKEKPIHEISIKKVCETADINRSTFYHHYLSPQELYDDIINDIANDMSGIISKNRANKSTNTMLISEMLQFVESKSELFLVILSDKGNIGIGERLTKIVGQFIGADNNSELSKYCVHFISAGIANIVWLWLNNDNRLPPKDVAGLISTIMTHGVRRAAMLSRSDYNYKNNII